jgi:hypothetical protein
MFLTEEVLKLYKFSEVKELQSENIFCISVTKEESKLDKSSDLKELQL